METLKVINQRLIDRYGRYLDGQPHYRVVWSEDQVEKRIINQTSENFILSQADIREVKKYGQYIHNKHILEKLVEVPEILHKELLHKLSYEPLWVFEDKNGNALPPIWLAIEVVIETVLENSAKAVGAKYTKEGWTREESEVRLKEMESILFGNETPVGDALAHKTGIIVPGGTNSNG